MPRKEALIAQAISHLAVDLACLFLLAGNFTKAAQTTVLIGAGYLIFVILSFGLRPFFGIALDEHPRIHSQTLGGVFVAIACLFPQRLAWIALFPAAVGSALFHTGAMGESVAFARGYFSRNAIILCPGVLGAALGTFLAQRTTLSGWNLSLLLGLCSIACFLFAEARKYPRRIRSFRHTVTRIFPDWAILGLTLIPALNGSLVLSLLPADWAKGAWALAPAASCMLGRLLGGFSADRFGPRKTLLASFSLALLLLTAFPHIPWLYCIGLGALCAPLSVTLGAATAALSTKPHFAAGVCSAAILMGTVPAFSQGAATDSVRILCAGLLILSLAVSLILYTDHCRVFNLRRKAKSTKRKGVSP